MQLLLENNSSKIYILACEIFEGNTPCGINAYCSSATGSALCLCTDGYETDLNDSLACIRIDVCNNIDCAGTFSNSDCVNVNDVGMCVCENNYEVWETQDSGATYAEYTTNTYFDIAQTNQFICNPSLPCLSEPCESTTSSVCIVENVGGLPTAHCQCVTGYQDTNNVENKIAAGNTLTCSNIDECTDGLHLCADTEVS